MSSTASTEVEIVVNGEPRRVVAGSSLLDLLAAAGHESRAVAVELDGVILKRALFGETVFAGGERVEIVRFVQGG